MSLYEKEARPGRCYCRARDEGASLNDIAKIITVLNHKILGLRNEVNAFKNVDNKKKSLLGNARDHLLVPCYETEPGKQPDSLMTLGTAVTHVVPFQTNSIVNYKLQRGRINEILAGILKNRINGKAYPNLICKGVPRIKRKKISRATQCDFVMERRRIRDFFNCFKVVSIIEENQFWKRNKAVGRCKKNNNRVSFNLDLEDMFERVRQEDSNDDGAVQTDSENSLDEEIDWTLGSVKIQQNKRKEMLHQLKGMQEDKDETTLQIDDKDENSNFEYSVTGRISGGADFRGNRIISDFGDKIQKICLYKTVKFDVQNVKRRLDVCIAELNGIIEDIILIFPDLNTSNI